MGASASRQREEYQQAATVPINAVSIQCRNLQMAPERPLPPLPPKDAQTAPNKVLNETLASLQTKNEIQGDEFQIPPFLWPDNDSIFGLQFVWGSQWCDVEPSPSEYEITICASSKPEPSFACLICLEDVNLAEAFVIRTCNHKICTSCAHDYIMAEILSRCFPIYCPLCKAESCTNEWTLVNTKDSEPLQETQAPRYLTIWNMLISFGRRRGGVRAGIPLFWGRNEPEGEADDEDFENKLNQESEITYDLAEVVLSGDEMDQFSRLALQKVIDTDRNYQRCPNVKCEGVFYNDDPTLTKMECVECLTICCWKCKTDTAHDGMSCQQYQALSLKNGNNREQMRFEELILNESWKRCPGCTMVTSKNEGCNKMTCDICHTYWCFRCGKKLNKNRPYLHYARKFSKCHNKLFAE